MSFPALFHSTNLQDDLVVEGIIDRLRSNDESLRAIQLFGSKLTGDTLMKMVDALENTACPVETLELKYCFIEGGIRVLIKALVGNSNIARMSFENCGVDDEDAKQLSNFLVVNTSLQNLHIGMGCIMSKDGIRVIAEGILVNEGLVDLDLSGSGIGNYGAFVLSSALQHNKALKTLNLQRTLVSNVGVIRLASALQDNSTLTTLNLAHTLVRQEGIRAMAQVLERRNTALFHVLLSTTKCSNQARVQLYTSQNRAGRGLLQNPKTPVSLAPVLLEKATHDPKALYGLLRELPQLWTTTTVV